MKNPVFEGSATALITPFTADTKDVDFSFFEELCQYQIDNQTDALVIAGTTGESPVLTKDEKKNLFSIAVQTAAGRIPVIAGTGSNHTEDVVRKANDAEKEGVDAVLVVTPYYNKCTQDGVIAHYFYIADRISCPMIVYNVPSRTGFNIYPETYRAIAEHKRIYAVKEANGDLSSIAKTRALCPEDFCVYSGNDDQTVPIMALGGKGVISVVSNIIPRQMHMLTQSALNGKTEEAAAMQLEFLELMNAMFSSVNPIPVKKAVELLWKKKQALRLPLHILPTPETEKLKLLLESYKLI